MKIDFFILIIFTIILGSCNFLQLKIDKVETKINYAENNINEMTGMEWKDLENLMQELEIDFHQNKTKISKIQVKKIHNLQGRYGALLVKKGINNFQGTLEDLGDQIEGFIEGFKEDKN